MSVQEFLSKFKVANPPEENGDIYMPESGWVWTSDATNYLACNLPKKRARPKRVYVVRPLRDKIAIELCVGDDNPGWEEVKKGGYKDVECVESGRDRIVRKALDWDGIDENDFFAIWDALGSLYHEFDALFRVDGGSVVLDEAVLRDCDIRALQVPDFDLGRATSRYALHWEGWDSFREYWDQFVGNWFDELGKNGTPNDELTNAFRVACANAGDGKLDLRELPEPYYGNPESAKGVLVHLNPGCTDENEISKVFGRGGFLIGQFEHGCQKKYSKYVDEWSSLHDYGDKAKHEKICGHDWWHSENRVSWIKRFWGSEITMNDVFALEACPYHSKSWQGSMESVENHIIQRVITPAIAAASAMERKVAVFVGSGFRNLIVKVKGIECVGCWRGTRTYSMYKYTPTASSGVTSPVHLLVLNGIVGMSLPKRNVPNLKIEEEILRIVKA